jgi:hypothetical protein
MFIEGEIVPRRDLFPRQCKSLGKAIRRWCRHFPMLKWVDCDAIGDLLVGELPQPASMRLAIELRRPWLHMPKKGTFPDEEFDRLVRDRASGVAPRPADFGTIKRALGEYGYTRTVPFALLGGREYDRAAVISSLREFLPADLLKDVVLDQRSWAQDP